MLGGGFGGGGGGGFGGFPYRGSHERGADRRPRRRGGRGGGDGGRRGRGGASNDWARERRALRAFRWARYFAALDLGVFGGVIVGTRGNAIKRLQAATRTHIEVPRADTANASSTASSSTALASVPVERTAERVGHGSGELCVGMCVHVYGRNKGNVVDCANRLVHLCCESAVTARGTGAGDGAEALDNNPAVHARHILHGELGVQCMMGELHGSGTLHRPWFGHCFMHVHNQQPEPHAFFTGSAGTGTDSSDSQRGSGSHVLPDASAVCEHTRIVLALSWSLRDLQEANVAARAASASVLHDSKPNALTVGSEGSMANRDGDSTLHGHAENVAPNDMQALLVHLLELLPAPLRHQLGQALDQEFVFVVPWHSSGAHSRRPRRHGAAVAGGQVMMYFDNEGARGHIVAGSQMLELAGQTIRALRNLSSSGSGECDGHHTGHNRGACEEGGQADDHAGDDGRESSISSTSSTDSCRPAHISLPLPPQTTVQPQPRGVTDTRAAAASAFRSRVAELVARGMAPTEAAALTLQELSLAQ